MGSGIPHRRTKTKIYGVDCLANFVGHHRMALCLEGRLPVELQKGAATRVHLPVGRGLLESDSSDGLWQREPLLANITAAPIQGRVAVGERARGSG